MRRTTACLLSASLLLHSALPSATIIWSGNGDGTRWFDANNWFPPAGSSTPRVPLASDDVQIVAQTNETVVIDVASAFARSIDTGGDGRLTIATALLLSDTDTTSTISMPVTLEQSATLTSLDPVVFAERVTSNGGILDGQNEGEFILQKQLIINRPAPFQRGLAINNADVLCNGGAEWFAGEVQLSDTNFIGTASELRFPLGTTLEIGPGGVMSGGTLRMEEGSFVVMQNRTEEARIDSLLLATGATFGRLGGPGRLLLSNLVAEECNLDGVIITESASLLSPLMQLTDCTMRDMRVEGRGESIQQSLKLTLVGLTLVDGLVIHTTSIRPDNELATVEVVGGSSLLASNFGESANSEVTIDNGRIIGSGTLEIETGSELDVADSLDVPGTKNFLTAPTQVFGLLHVPRFHKITDPTGATTPRVTIEKGGVLRAQRETNVELSVDCHGAIEIGNLTDPGPVDPDPDRVVTCTGKWQILPGGTAEVAELTQWFFSGGSVTSSTSLEVPGGGKVTLGEGSELTVANGNLFGELIAPPSAFFTVDRGRFRIRNGSRFDPQDVEIIGENFENNNETFDPELIIEAPFTIPRLRMSGDCNISGPPVTVTEFLSMKGGELKIPGGDFTLAATATAILNGEFTSTSGMAVRIGNGTRFMNRGAITWTSTFAPIFRSTATASFVNEGTMLLDTNDSTFGSGAFINRGTIEKVGALTNSVLRDILHESGLIENEAGRLVLSGGELRAQVRTLETGRTAGSNGVRLTEGCALTGDGTFGIDAEVFVEADVPARNVVIDNGIGVLRGAGNMLVDGEFRWADGDINMGATGGLTILPGATLLMEPADPLALNNFWRSGIIDNFGTAIWSDAGNANLFAEKPAAFNNRDTGEFFINGRGRLFFTTNEANRISVANEGVLLRGPGAARRGDTGPDETGLGFNLTNSGAITLESGLARVEGTFVQNGGELNFNGGSLQHLGIDSNGAPVLQTGAMQFNDGAINVNAPGTIMGEVRVNGDTEVLINGTTWIIAGKFGIEGVMTVIDGKVVHFSQGLDGFPSPQQEPALYEGSLFVRVGLLGFGSEWFGDVTFTPQSFTEVVGARFLVAGAFKGLGRMRFNGKCELQHFGRGVSAPGVASATRGATAPQEEPAIYAGEVTVEGEGGTISGEAVLTTSATLRVEGAPFVTEGPLTIEGQAILNGGTLTNKGRTPGGDPAPQAEPIILRSATVQVTADSEIDGDMTLEGTANQFVVKPGATLTAAVTQLDLTSAALTIETVGGATPRAGKLKARRRSPNRGGDGEIVLGGVFNLSFVGTPEQPMPPNTTFRAVEAAALTGSFGSVSGLTVPGGTFATSQGPTFFALTLGGPSSATNGWLLY
ncbi:MAG: hypothetical protein SF028_03335 [Candidatus Sumerlaeia bacterium]|nr:hypothetical protein [Candidatus Sumerlaeia bacterium]